MAMNPAFGAPFTADSRTSGFRCRSSVVEHFIGNEEVDSSILSGSTSFQPNGMRDVSAQAEFGSRAFNVLLRKRA
jgi:hypothetical protein